MATSKKQRKLPTQVQSEQEEPLEGGSGSDVEETDESDDELMDQEVQVEFEARPPEDSDFHGIKTLLQQLFLKSKVDLGDLTDTIISQNYVGSVIKQVDVEEDDDDDMEDDSGDAVFGLVTAVNVTDKQDKECIKQLIAMLVSHCQRTVPEMVGKVKEVLQNPEEHVGFLINERYINIPTQIAVPSFQSLRKDLEKACKKKMNYAFRHILMLCKTYRNKTGPSANDSPLFYTNGEEELIAEVSDIQVTWSVAEERDGVADGRWEEDEMEATRTMLIFSADKLESIIHKFETMLAT